MDLAGADTGSDEGRFEFAAEAAHFGESEFECSGHVLAGHVAGGEDKLADGVLLEGAFFKQVVADALIGRYKTQPLEPTRGSHD